MFIEHKLKEILFKNLNIKYINQLRRLKWSILNRFTDDLKKIESSYNEELEIKVLEKLIPYLSSISSSSLPPIAIDIGANIGVYSHYLSEFIEKFHGRCIGFEPRSDILGRLKKNVKKKNYTAERLALSDEIGFADLYLPASHENSSLIAFDHFSGFKKERVNLFTLDNYVSLKNISPQAIIFIKVDVEGYELEVLSGGEITISSAKPIIMCESENRHLLPQGKTVQFLIDFMKNIGFRGYAISNRYFQILPIEQISIPYNKLNYGEYFYNFWFLPEDRSIFLIEKIGYILEQIKKTKNSSNIQIG